LALTMQIRGKDAAYDHTIIARAAMFGGEQWTTSAPIVDPVGGQGGRMFPTGWALGPRLH